MDKRIDIKLLLGDVLDKMKCIEDNSIDLIVTDPPYNLNKDYGNTKDNLIHEDYIDFTRKWVKEAHRVPQKYYRSINNMRGANPGNVWEFSHVHYCNVNRKKHPTQKPEALFERMILASSNEGDTVLDCFLGSETSARVCQQLNRNFIGIEINEEYFNIACERLEEPFAGSRVYHFALCLIGYKSIFKSLKPISSSF